MPFIPNKIKIQCQAQDHNPPTMQVFPPEGGIWRCSSCGFETEILPQPTCNIKQYKSPTDKMIEDVNNVRFETGKKPLSDREIRGLIRFSI